MRALVLALAALAAVPSHAETIAITGGRVVIGDGSATIDDGNVVVRDGRIVAAGAAASVPVPAGATVVDARGKWVSPGLVAGFSRVGLVEVDAVDQTNDADAPRSSFSASLDVAPAINPRASAIAVNRAAGITRAVVAPDGSGSIFAGQGAVIDLGADMDAVTRAGAFQFVEFGENGAGRAGGSRTASHAAFRDALSQARDFARNPAGFDGRSSDALLNRRDAAALAAVIDGRTPLIAHVERAADILQMLALRREFPALKLVLVGAAEGWTVAPQIAAAGVPVIASALVDLPAAFETLAATQSNIGRMRRAGVAAGIGMINNDEARQIRLIKQYAGNLVALEKVPGAAGLDWPAAFATISSKPAEALGMGGEIGSLRPGRRGDVVIWDGDPLELSTAAIAVWIDGVRQPLDNRQTRLRDRYLEPQEGALPKAYQRQ